MTSAGGNSYSYDANGNMTDHAGNAVTYDAEGRLATYTVGTTTVSFTYDADGTLVKREAGNTTVYVTDRYQKNTSTDEVTKYYYFGERRVAARIAGTLYGLLTDHLGSTMVLVDGGGNVAGEMEKWRTGFIFQHPSSILHSPLSTPGAKRPSAAAPAAPTPADA